MLEIGIQAPDFELPDQDGVMHKLSDYKGKKVILYFYPKDNTAGCTKQACGFSERYPQFLEKGAAILGVSKDTVASHKKFQEKYGLAFTLLADPERKVIEAYDVWKEKKNYGKVSMGVVRTTYLIDESGIIVRANDKVKAANDAENMLEVVQTLLPFCICIKGLGGIKFHLGDTMWILYATGSAFFAGITSILAKCGISKTDSDVATAIRTVVVLVFSWILVLLTGTISGITDIGGKTLLFLVLSGIATGANWLCYFKALQNGNV